MTLDTHNRPDGEAFRRRVVAGASLGPQAWVRRKDQKPLSEERFEAPVNGQSLDAKKPDRHTGLWTSTYQPRHGSGWCQFCLTEGYHIDPDDPVFDLAVLDPDPGARIFVVDDLPDLIALLLRFPRPRSPAEIGRRAGYGLAGEIGDGVDFEAAALELDAIHLTERGAWRTRLSDPVDLYTWDCESTLWLRWRFVAVRSLGRVRVTERSYAE